jgi:hypothetical protein
MTKAAVPVDIVDMDALRAWREGQTQTETPDDVRASLARCIDEATEAAKVTLRERIDDLRTRLAATAVAGKTQAQGLRRQLRRLESVLALASEEEVL